MKDKMEGYHPVPSIRRSRAAHPIGGSAGGDKTNLTDEHGPVTRTEVEKHDDGTAHVTAHHAKGHVEVHQHPNVGAAHEHATNLMSGGDPMNSDGKSGEEGEEGECPSCGGPMKDGKCQQCGYEDKSAAATALGGGKDEDGGY